MNYVEISGGDAGQLFVEEEVEFLSFKLVSNHIIFRGNNSLSKENNEKLSMVTMALGQPGQP